MTQMEFADGKYTVKYDNGHLTALRYGEPWQRDLTGDKLVYHMLVAAMSLTQQRDALLSVAQSVAGQAMHTYPNQSVCRCSQCDLVREAQAALAGIQDAG